MDDCTVWEPDENASDNEDLVAGILDGDGHEILRDDLELDEMNDDIDSVLENEFGL